MRLRILVAVAPFLFPQVAAAQSTWWEESPQVVRVNSGPRGEVTYRKGDDLVRLPLLWGNAAQIEAPVTFDFAGEKETIPANATLPLVQFRANGQQASTRKIYCTRSRITERIKSGGLMGILQSKLINSLSDTQKCLEDTDNDGKLDRTLIIGEGDNDFTIGGPIAPLSFKTLGLAPIDGNGDYLELNLISVGKNKVQIWLGITRQGKALQFQRISSGGITSQRFTTLKTDGAGTNSFQIFGVRMDIVSIDPVAKTATIKWPDDAPQDLVLAVPIDVRATYY